MTNRVLTVIFLALYPAAVYVALRFGGVRIAALVAVVILGYRFLAGLKEDRGLRKILVIEALAVGAILAAGLVWKSDVVLKLVPAGIGYAIFVSFFASLFTNEPLVERFARLKRPDLAETERAYCRKVTWVWSVVIFLNASVAGATAFLSTEVWALYCGFVGYIFLGLVFAVEYLVRRRRLGREPKPR